LIAEGHPPAAVLDYSPKQLDAFLIIARDRKRRELREQLLLDRVAAQGDDKAIKAALKDLDE
jgi:hypothetical protein